MKKDIFDNWDWEEVDENDIEEDRLSSTEFIHDCFDDLHDASVSETEEYHVSQWTTVSSGSSGSSASEEPKTKTYI